MNIKPGRIDLPIKFTIGDIETEVDAEIHYAEVDDEIEIYRILIESEDLTDHLSQDALWQIERAIAVGDLW